MVGAGKSVCQIGWIGKSGLTVVHQPGSSFVDSLMTSFLVSGMFHYHHPKKHQLWETHHMSWIKLHGPWPFTKAKMALVDGFLHGDLHPGNLFIELEGTAAPACCWLGLVGWVAGCVGWLLLVPVGCRFMLFVAVCCYLLLLGGCCFCACPLLHSKVRRSQGLIEVSDLQQWEKL